MASGYRPWPALGQREQDPTLRCPAPGIEVALLTFLGAVALAPMGFATFKMLHC